MDTATRIKDLEAQLVDANKSGVIILGELKAAQDASNALGLIGMIGSPAWIGQIKKLQNSCKAA